MKLLIGIKNIIIFIVLIFLLAMVASAFVTLKPPASVVTTLFRMAFQMLQKYLVFALTIIFVICFIYICMKLKSHTRPGLFLIISTFLIVVCLIGNIVSLLKISSVKAFKSNIKYTESIAGRNREIDPNSYEKEDLSGQVGLDQCSVFTSKTSPYKETCVIYLNYGGWSMQDESYGNQIYQFCQKEGYTFVRLAYDRKQDEKIVTLAKLTNQGINQLLELKKYKSVYLCGGSAGGHMALLSAFLSEDNQLGAAPIQSTISGVIALYPNVDPAFNYDYYVLADSKSKNPVDRLGDLLYSKLYNGASGTLAGETKALDERIFGKREEDGSFYQSTRIANLIEDKSIPVLIVQGSLDSMIAVDSCRSLYSDLKKQNKIAVYLELPGAEHVFDMMDTSAWDRCEKELTGFIRQLELK